MYHALLTVPSARCSLIFSITKCRYCPRCFHIIPKWTVIFRQCWPPMPPCIYSGVPFNGPVSAARVGHINGIAVVNPTQSELAESKLDLIVAGSENGVLMVESEARELPEEEMLKAIMTGHREMQTFITAVQRIRRASWQTGLGMATTDIISRKTRKNEIFDRRTNLPKHIKSKKTRTRNPSGGDSPGSQKRTVG